jgi:hypothetical protein
MGTLSLKQIQQQFYKILGRDLSARVSRAGIWTFYFIGIGIHPYFHGFDGRIPAAGTGR